MTYRIKPILVATGFTALLAVSGCAGTETKPAPVVEPRTVQCTVPVGRDLNAALQEARSTLSKHACQYHFDEVTEALMNIAKGAPGTEHRKTFHEYFVWAVEQGIITKVQAKEAYTQYFTTSYAASLPDNVSTCGIGSNDKDVMSRLAAEVHKKETGLMGVLGDRDAWFRAKRAHDNLVFLLQGTLRACQAGL